MESCRPYDNPGFDTELSYNYYFYFIFNFLNFIDWWNGVSTSGLIYYPSTNIFNNVSKRMRTNFFELFNVNYIKTITNNCFSS